MPGPIEAILIGAGQRGAASYAPYALAFPDRLHFVAVAEPDEERRALFAATHSIPTDRQFSSWEELLALPQLGAAAFICTQDWQHTGPALAALQAGYHVLLEKPMATTAEECCQLVQASEDAGRELHICHVLRYTRHFQKMREIIQSGVLGQVIDVSHRENVSFWHMAHSYVRGNWRSKEQTSPMILAKCCHDFDILLWLLDRHCLQLSSVGALTHFRPQNAPPGAPERCLDGCPVRDECPYYAPWLYRDLVPFWRSVAETTTKTNARLIQTHLDHPAATSALAHFAPTLRQVTEYRGWPLTVLAAEPTPENIEHALREGPYGRCVYRCDNDVVDHQVVSMQFEDEISVTLTMHGHSHIEQRTTRIEGTRGRLLAGFGNGGAFIEVAEHRPDRHTRYQTSSVNESGHGGGDFGLVSAFLESIQNGAAARTTARQALESHLLAFAAEKARLEKRVLEGQSLR
jgi:predicted dehydrogenase